MAIKKFYVIPIDETVNEKKLDSFLRKHNICFSIPSAMTKEFVEAYEKSGKSLGIFIRDSLNIEELDKEYYYVVRQYSSPTSQKNLWEVYSRRMSEKKMAEDWMEFWQGENPKHEYFIVKA